MLEFLRCMVLLSRIDEEGLAVYQAAGWLTPGEKEQLLTELHTPGKGE